MKKTGKKLIALALAAAMTLTAASLQAMAAGSGVPGTPTAAAVQSMTDQAVSNSLGLAGHSNGLMEWQVSDYGNLYVNSFSGNVTFHEELFTATASEYPPMELEVTYNSQDTEDFGMGPGMRTNYDQRLLHNEDGSYTYIDGTGTPIIFRDGFAEVGGMQYYLVTMEDKLVVQADTRSYYFDEAGRLVQVYGAGLVYHYTVDVAYNSYGLVESLTPYCYDQGNRKTVFHYRTANGRVLLDFVERFSYFPQDEPQIVGFQYEDDGRLNLIDHYTAGKVTGLYFHPENRLLDMVNGCTLDYLTDGSVPLVTEVFVDNGQVSAGQYQYLYGNSQTVVRDPSGIMQLRTFNQDGIWTNPQT